MNAVKRCLALFAAILVASACSGDPTAEDAGTGLTIRTTPAVIWMLENEPAQIDLEAIDALGGTQPGSWTATPAGPFTVALDPDYQPTSSGPLGAIRRFIITPTAAGEGTITFAGTGGNKIVTVRVSPDPEAFDAVISDLTPAIADPITVTAPAGVRFNALTEVNFVSNGDNAVTNGLAAPSIVSMTADSGEMVILPAPGAHGRLQFTEVSNVSTPSLTVTTMTTDSVDVPALTSVAAVLSSTAPAANTALTITMPANFLFRPTSAMTQAGAAMGAFVLSRSADSTSVTIVPMPGFATPIGISAVQFAPLATLSLTLPTSDTVTVAAINIGADDPEAGAVGNLGVPTTVGAANARVNWDAASFGSADYTADGGDAAQFYLVTFANAGTYNISTQWTGSADIDAILVPDNGNYGGPTGAEILALSAGVANPEAFSFTATAGQTALLAVINWNGGSVTALRVVVTRTS